VTGFPVFPVEPGIFAILPDKYGFGTGNGEANQVLASEFPLLPKREFLPA
jgi:hypothetical protein